MRQAHAVSHRPGSVRARERDHAGVLRPALSGTFDGWSGEPAARRGVRGRSRDGHRLKAANGVVAGAGVGVADQSAKLRKLGIEREDGLVLHLPLRYEDLTRVTPIRELRAGELAQVEGEVVRSEVSGRGRRTLVVELRDASATLTLRFFHFYPSQRAQLAPGNRVRAWGEPRGGLFGTEIVHPQIRVVRPGEPLPQRLTPVYPAAAGIGQAWLRAAVRRALDVADWDDAVPAACSAALGLMAPLAALRLLHEPPAGADLESLQQRTPPAWQRVIFDELLAQQLSLRRAREERAARSARPLANTALADRLRAALPFTLTGAQQRVWREIGAELAANRPMNRLLQGDVGSGKTVVAALAASQAIGSGAQAALMAPTEILAEQHLVKLRPWLERVGARVAWLASSLKQAEKRKVRAAVAAGEVDLLVGTHALIEQSVEFERLGLAIVDEQHRFGVAQRLALRAKSDEQPHQLMMSATPIPRTLAMSYYADLDVSVIDELPPGRRPVVTKLLAESRRDELVGRVRAAVASGRQAYWVCPLVEESEALDLQNAIDTRSRLSQELAPLSVGLVHGRLSGADKQSVMEQFTRGAIDVLVATTVIEVGVDVSNASLMVIEHAERFGLAQLHQLRGRVGRGVDDSVCVLMYRAPLSDTARERLRVMYETTDGFEIARRDLALRGPGEFLGARQSGVPLLRFADLERDAALVDAARDCAQRLMREDPQAAHRHLQRWLAGREAYIGA
ncbi:MAG: ATP-dependent DNA helicase RecG [Burkholderiaceae bacterium]|nr:ATP-dependent DNA helicase RecG [Burkholderiaceae bacterium]